MATFSRMRSERQRSHRYSCAYYGKRIVAFLNGMIMEAIAQFQGYFDFREARKGEYIMRYQVRYALCALAASLLLACCVTSAHATWLDIDIGSPTVAGSHTEGTGTVTVTGAGTGDAYYGTDQLHYTYQTNAGGDLDIIARIAAFSGNAHARAGIMLRTTNAANATTANAVFVYQDASGGKHNLYDTGRDQTSNTCVNYGATTNMALPLWVRLVRIGQHFAVYKSPDGIIWSSPGASSGWKFIPSGSIEVGFFAAGGAAGTTCTATFDNISIGTPNLGYSTSWIGNTFGGSSLDGHVSNGVSAMWTAPDGTCYTNSWYDEGWGESAKIYKDGQVVKPYVYGNSECNEGTVTSDGTKVYWAGASGCNYLSQSDMQGNNAWPMLMITNLWDAAKSSNVISGMATVGNKLYLGNERDNTIMVAQTDLPRYYTMNWSTVANTSTTIDTTGVLHAAPATLYQTQRRCGDFLPYVVPNLTANSTYTVRCHFAEYTETQTGQRLVDVDINGATPVRNYDVVAAAGGTFKAAVLDIPNATTDASGNLTITFNPANRHGGGGDGVLIICGFEVLTTGGSQVFALNCAGGPVSTFQAEANELASLSFPFTRPGPMVADSRGDLWIIQEANDFPIGTTVTTKYPGVIKCYHTNGTYAGKQITDVVNPVALAYDAVNDRLLIADNSVNQDIAIYNNLATTPAFQSSFGVLGGLYAGASPGRINDPASGGYARFYGLTGVGIDSTGNIYVSSSLQGTDVRKFTPSGTLVWMVNGLPFCTVPAIDPANETEAYATYWHATLNYANTAPGSEWSYTGYTWNAALYGPPQNQSGSQAIVRRVNGAKILYTGAQGSSPETFIYRFNGEIAVPCGLITANAGTVWIDLNGDGLQTSDEVVTGTSPGSQQRFTVDEHGDIWAVCIGSTTPLLRHFRCKGLNGIGAPIYTLTTGDYEDIAYPSPGQTYGMWGQRAAVHYDAVHDIMYLVGPANTRTQDADPCLSYLARYDAWSTGNRTARWLITLPDPSTGSANFPNETWLPYGCVFTWNGFDVADANIFLAELWGPVHVFNADTGVQTRILSPGPEVDGFCAWDDSAQGCTAFTRSNGETIIFTENSGFDAKCNMYRLSQAATQGTTCSAPVFSPLTGTYDYGQPVTIGSLTTGASIRYTTDGTTPSDTVGTVYSGPVALTASCTLQAIAYKSGITNSSVTSAVYTVRSLCAAPTFSPAPGTFTNSTTVTISTTTTGASIRYTTDGTTPSDTVGTLYSSPLTLTATCTLQAIAYKTGMTNSTVTSGAYTCVAPLSATFQYMDGWVASPYNTWYNDGYFTSALITTTDTPLAIGQQDYDNRGVYWFSLDLGSVQTVSAVKIWNYFRNDGCEQGRSFRQLSLWVTNTAAADGANGETNVSIANPTPTVPQQLLNQSNGSSALTTIAVPGSPSGRYVLLRFFGTYGNPTGGTTYGDYEGFNGIEVLGQVTAAPTFSPAAGTYNGTQNVTITSATTGASIRYTTDGTTPTSTIGTLYSTPVAITASATLKAIAYKTGYVDSPVASGVYTINAPLSASLQYQDGWVASPYNQWYSANYTTALITTNDTPLSTAQQTYDNRGTYWISLDLGSAQAVNTVKFWNYYVAGYGSANASRSYRQIAIWVTDMAAADGSNGSTNVSTTYPTPNVALQLLNQTQSSDSAPALTTISVPGSPTGRYVLLELFGTYGNPTGGTTNGDYEGFNGIEVLGGSGSTAAATPTFSPAAGIYGSAQSVTISTTTSGAAIRYTTDGTTPSDTVGTVYSTPVNISSSCTLKAIAYKSGMGNSTVTTGVYTIDTPPTVSITAPTPSQVFTAPASIAITATASDTDGTISKVEFYNGANLLGTSSTSPYSFTWTNVAAGSYTLTAKAYDNYNLTTTSSGVNVISDAPPTVSLTAPAANTNYIAPASVALTATASDSDGTISKVEFYQGSTLVGTVSTSPYSYTWNSVAMGNYSLTAKAYDNNNVTTTSSAVNIIVWGTSDIGSVGVAGSASYSGGTFTVSGAGAGVTSTADAFRYVYRQFSGNTTIVARVASATSATTAERAGVMMRQNLNANSIEASALYKPTSTYYVYFLRRTSAGGSTSSTTSSTAAAPPYWVKVVRSSNTLSAFMSANGSSWTAVGSGTTVTMTDPIYVGLAVTSGSTSAAKTVTFDNVSITQP